MFGYSNLLLVDGVSYLRCHLHSYVPQANSSNPSVVNCSLIQDYVCGDARRRASESTGIKYSITRVARSAVQRKHAMFILPLHLLMLKLMEIRRRPPAPQSMAKA